MVGSIVRATNWQNAIKYPDLISNDSIQVFLEREFRKKGYQYIRKRQSKLEANALYGGHGYTVIKKEELGHAIAACTLDPYIIRQGIEKLFEEHYRDIFNSSHSISYYLIRYWLMRRVQHESYGYPARAYAKWLVLSFIWDYASKYIDHNEMRKRVIYACEKNIDNVLKPLSKVIVNVFRSTMTFYRKYKRGKGEIRKYFNIF